MPMNESQPNFRADGDLSTVDGLLIELGVFDKSILDQKRAIRKATKSPFYRHWVGRLGPELVARGLV